MTIERECGVSTAAESKKTNSIDMLHGPLAKKIVLFSIPLAITSILQLFYAGRKEHCYR